MPTTPTAIVILCAYHQVTGHMFAYPIVHDLVKNDTVEAEALYVPGPALMCGCV